MPAPSRVLCSIDAQPPITNKEQEHRAALIRIFSFILFFFIRLTFLYERFGIARVIEGYKIV
jgi:hypothetical protein